MELRDQDQVQLLPAPRHHRVKSAAQSNAFHVDVAFRATVPCVPRIADIPGEACGPVAPPGAFTDELVSCATSSVMGVGVAGSPRPMASEPAASPPRARTGGMTGTRPTGP
eukprot:4347350-Amphidinium_carterae.1